MSGQTLLIADSSEDFLLAMAEALQLRYRVLLCRDGKTALSLLRQEPCDLLVLDLHLPELDGLTLLEQAVSQKICPSVIALTPLLNDYAIQSSQRLGVRYLLRKPCEIPAVVTRVEDLFLETDAAALVAKRTQLTELLLKLGIPSRLDGYRYLAEGVLMYYQNPQQAFTKELYPKIGKPTKHSAGHVERSIRNALGKAWEIRDDALWQECFACGDSRPSVSDTIIRLAEILRQTQE